MEKSSNLEDVVSIVSPTIVAFVSRGVRLNPGADLPLLPKVFATGFFINACGLVATNGHVVRAFEDIQKHPVTGEAGVATMVFCPGPIDRGAYGQHLIIVDIKGYLAVDSFESKKDESDWYGQTVPDIGFVQLNVCETPFLGLAEYEFCVRPGMSIATIGYPLGDLPLSAFGRINQLSPFVRRGIVSSVFPFSVPDPHGFTIDIMQQGGSSGSPILRLDRPEVVGMMSASILEPISARIDGRLVEMLNNTNISVAETAGTIGMALESFRSVYTMSTEGVPTLRERLEEPEASSFPEWGIFPFG